MVLCLEQRKRFFFTIFLFAALILFFNCSFAFTPFPSLNGITIGSTYADVIKAWGKPNLAPAKYEDGAGFLNFINNYFLVKFLHGRVWTLDFQFEKIVGTGNGITIQQANKIRNLLLPHDAILIKRSQKSIAPSPGRDEFFVYKSQYLGHLFPSDDFYDNELDKLVPGEFLIIYNFNKREEIFGLSISPGNCP